MRTSGVLMHISSLPSPYGIGTFGRASFQFVDFLFASGQSFWQILPLGQTSYGDSPYQSFSTYAGNPYFVDLDILAGQGLLRDGDYQGLDWGGEPDQVDYGKLYERRYPVLRTAAQRFLDEPRDEFSEFCAQESRWLEDYALFMALKDCYSGAPWYDWEEPLRRRQPEAVEKARAELSEDIFFWKAVQFWFFSQWRSIKQYANDAGVKIIGDLPIYVAADSVDVWANPGEFQLDENLKPVDVAGCPPDGFSEGGQLWGNPLYRWDRMKDDDYRWWFGRIDQATALFDVIRIDHFRGFDSFYAIPAGRPDAKIGRWEQGPGISFFRRMRECIGEKEIIAEDLGFLTDSVRDMVRRSGYPGMKVLQFAFDSRGDSDYLPYHYGPECVVYTGTHDNDTILGWIEHAPEVDIAFAKRYLGLSEEEGVHWGVMRGALESVGALAILTMQDILGLDGRARMNTPSTVGCNWMWRMRAEAITPELAQKLREYTATYGRAKR